MYLSKKNFDNPPYQTLFLGKRRERDNTINRFFQALKGIQAWNNRRLKKPLQNSLFPSSIPDKTNCSFVKKYWNLVKNFSNFVRNYQGFGQPNSIPATPNPGTVR